MKAVQVSNTLLRATTSPPSFLLPAFSRPLTLSNSISRTFTSDASLRAASGTAEARTSTTTQTPARQNQPHTNESISQTLGDIVNDARPPPGRYQRARGRINAGSQPSILRDFQDGLFAKEIGLAAGTAGVEKPEPPVRLHPYLGRTVEVTERGGLHGALKMLQIGIARNKVAVQSREQKFYERPGLKRKRIKSLRWRKRFFKGFQATVNKVKEMRRMGW